jgi:hypothetical protein
LDCMRVKLAPWESLALRRLDTLWLSAWNARHKAPS